MRQAIRPHVPFILLMLALAGIMFGVPVGLFTISYAIFPPNTPDPQEIVVLNNVAATFEVKRDWDTVFNSVSYTYIPLGLTRTQVHAKLASLGSFTVEREEHYYLDVYNRDVDDEFLTFDDVYLNQELGKRGYIYDSVTGLLIESYVLLPSGEAARLLPPPPQGN